MNLEVPLKLQSADWAGLLMCVQVFKLNFTMEEVHEKNNPTKLIK